MDGHMEEHCAVREGRRHVLYFSVEGWVDVWHTAGSRATVGLIRPLSGSSWGVCRSNEERHIGAWPLWKG